MENNERLFLRNPVTRNWISAKCGQICIYMRLDKISNYSVVFTDNKYSSDERILIEKSTWEFI
jgi:hypothetical protein